MLKVYEKTEKEIAEEKSLYEFGAHIAHGPTFSVCHTYVVTKQGERFDTDNLTEAQILSFVKQAIKDGVTSFKNNKFDKSGKIDEFVQAFKLMKSVKDTYDPSYAGLKEIINLFNDNDFIVRGISKDILTQVASEKLHDVKTITKYVLESRGEFKEPTKEQLFETVDQLITNEKNKSAEKSRNK